MVNSLGRHGRRVASARERRVGREATFGDGRPRGEIDDESAPRRARSREDSQDLRGFAFDLDGTIWEGPRLLPGAVELVADLRAAGLGVVFASNCSRHGSGVLCDASSPTWASSRRPTRCSRPSTWPARKSGDGWGRCRSWSIGTDELGRVLASSRSHDRPGRAMARGQGGRRRGRPGLQLRPAPRRRAGRRAGAAFFAINLDARFPVGPGEFDPGCGALAEAIAVAGGVRPIAIGKPEPPLFQVAIERLGCSAAPGGHGRRQHGVRHRRRTRRGDVHDLARSRTRARAAARAASILKVRDLRELHQLWRGREG